MYSYVVSNKYMATHKTHTRAHAHTHTHTHTQAYAHTYVCPHAHNRAMVLRTLGE